MTVWLRKRFDGEEMMRAILVLIGLAALVVVVMLSLGMMSIQTTPGSLPTVALQGGQAPAVKANVGSIDLVTTNKTVEVPTVTTTEKTIAVPSIEVKRAEAPANAQ